MSWAGQTMDTEERAVKYQEWKEAYAATGGHYLDISNFLISAFNGETQRLWEGAAYPRNPFDDTTVIHVTEAAIAHIVGGRHPNVDIGAISWFLTHGRYSVPDRESADRLVTSIVRLFVESDDPTFAEAIAHHRAGSLRAFLLHLEEDISMEYARELLA